MSAYLPAPIDLGLPDAFSSWRPGQVEAILRAIDAPQRFKGLVLPTGFGKSLVYMAIAHLTGTKTVILTSTKALQKQLMRDFRALDGTLVVQGQRAYTCHALEPGGELHTQYGDTRHDVPTVDHGPCHAGVDCSLKQAGCGYFDTLRGVGRASIIITNYAWWFTLVRKQLVPLRPDLLVLDEAHAAPDALADALGATVSPGLVGAVLNEKLPAYDERSPAHWIEWARTRASRLAGMLEGTHPTTREAMAKVRRAQLLLYALDAISHMDARLLVVSPEQEDVRFDIVWAADYGEPHLFRRVPRVVLTSATMTAHTAGLLGIMEKDLLMYEAGDGFPVARRPVYVAPAALPPFGQAIRVDHRLTPAAETAWLDHLDRWMAARADRKGIIHSVSYRRRDLIIARSAHRERMMTHSRHDTATQIRRFKDAPPGTILVSPSVTTGYDFPYDQCEFQLVAKIPFPDGRDPVTKARTLVDPKYPAHLAMQTLVQMVGRGMRAADDQCETAICDAHAQWFLSRHLDLAPRWFRKAIERLDPGTAPAPPPTLTQHADPAEGEDDNDE